jgi:phospholipid/cholesterol/gamma-HCH transport system permease protein
MPVVKSLRVVGHRTVNAVWRLGYASRFLVMTLFYSGASFRRFHLTIKEMFSSGVMSLIIILVAGMFVGMVLGLQGYETLKRYGSESALGSLVALSLVRELGPVLAALLFASRAGSALLGGGDFHAAALRAVFCHGRFWRLCGWSGADRSGRRLVLVADAKFG